MSRRHQLAAARSAIGEEIYRFDYRKSFFELNGKEMDMLEFYKKICNFRGRNDKGRSELRQFWYHLQYGWDELPF